MKTAIILLQCPDKAGIIAKLSTWIFKHGGNILSSNQYSTDPTNGQFFIRIEFCFDGEKISIERLQEDFKVIATDFNANWQLLDKDYKKRFAILVSKGDHCLHDLLYHWQRSEIHGEVTAIISNHRNCETLANSYQLPFHHLPVNEHEKQQQEQRILKLINNTDFLVLARYMQILSKDFLSHYKKDIINIHHSFLPSFKGKNPYLQAHHRGVKIIGATAHYVTEDLDEGPIIEQRVERVSHQDAPQSMQAKGRHIERRTLLQAVAAQCDNRIIRYQNKTIVFK